MVADTIRRAWSGGGGRGVGLRGGFGEGGVDLGAQLFGELADRGGRVERVEAVELAARLLHQAVAEEHDGQEGVHVWVLRVGGGGVDQIGRASCRERVWQYV